MRDRIDRLRRVAAAIVLACLVLGGCEGERYIETPPALCLEACVDGRISDLSSVDHETLSGDAIRAIHESCAATAEPCCKAYGSQRYVRLTCPEPAR